MREREGITPIHAYVIVRHTQQAEIFSLRSLLGGQLLDISGEGFGTEPSLIEVLLGDHPCNVKEMSDTLIRCVTSPATTTHIIDNNM